MAHHDDGKAEVVAKIPDSGRRRRITFHDEARRRPRRRRLKEGGA